MPTSKAFRPIVVVFALLPLLLLAACGDINRAEDVPDPYEAQNRAVFDANTALFNSLSGADTDGAGPEIPPLVTRTIGNLAQNLDTPKIVVNDLLQGDGESVVHNSFRFIINSTMGVLGLFDPAAGMGLEVRDNDFGKTLYVWGAGPGNYTVLPIIGPRTERDLAGMAADTLLNPLGFFLPSTEQWYARGIKVGDKVASALKYGDTIGDVLNESADPYLAAQSAYLQNRRYELTGGAIEDDYIDPYEELFGN